ncbi:MAG: UTP--glucose-1-phosphate uridylyltransferase [Elusimicrobia bacterium RIFOXYA2_FULL_40_6]|nr:MAG: UTP--glucose-1-phosphate uridylyltransferase [Elusimicrobia bacterium RIFOXYA2_FULL_40_6]
MIRKAVIPAAGFGTRFLPASKSQPKEMLPIVDTPVIQYVVEEAVASGITDILMIIGKGKRAIEEHFDRNFELESELSGKGKEEELKTIKRLSRLANIHFVWQKELKGLGDAISYARDHTAGEPFAMLLGDTIVDSKQPVTKQLIGVYNKYHKAVVALEEVERSKVSRYGIISGKEIKKNIYKIKDLVEKPKVEEAPSKLAIAGRYIFTSEIFDYIDKTPPGKNNEIQLTDSMKMLAKSCGMYGLKFDGRRYDIGSKVDFVKTNVTFALKRAELREEITSFIKKLSKEL